MNILVIKTGALGDVVRTGFIAQALSDKYRNKDPRIFWITDEKAKAFFINNPYVHSVINSKNKERIRHLFFDLIINLEEDEENARFVSSLNHGKILGIFLNKKGKIEYTESSAEWFDMSLVSVLGKKSADEKKIQNKKTHRELISQIIGVNSSNYEPFLRLNKNQRQIVKDFLRRYNLSRVDLIIGINTGAADRWPKALSVKKTAKIIDEIYKKYSAKILLFGGLNEIDRNREIIKISKSPIIDAGCGNDLMEFPALISVCSFFITTDSLGLHISLALKRKTICLIGPTSNSEIDMYGIGEKILAKSDCVCCYKRDCKSMDKIDTNSVVSSVSKLIGENIAIVINAFNEPNIGKSIEAALNQKTSKNYEIFVIAPDEKTLDIARRYSQENKKIKILIDPGKGKNYALNIAFEKIDTDILILTDGDLTIGENVVEEMSKLFSDPEIGCMSGRPVCLEDKKTKYGYWANFLFESAHRIRKKAFDSNSFIECSGYLFSFRKNKINKIPLDVAEDTYIPYVFWQKGYKIGYSEEAKVFVKNPNNLRDWIKQKKRTIKSHEKLHRYVDVKTTPRVKNFKNEAKGLTWLLRYPGNLAELSWSFELAFLRAYLWLIAHLEYKFKIEYTDAWERVESTK